MVFTVSVTFIVNTVTFTSADHKYLKTYMFLNGHYAVLMNVLRSAYVCSFPYLWRCGTVHVTLITVHSGPLYQLVTD